MATHYIFCISSDFILHTVKCPEITVVAVWRKSWGSYRTSFPGWDLDIWLLKHKDLVQN